jgi:CHASE3 domain sensor protein
MTDEEKERWLASTSPEFQAHIRAKEAKEAAKEAAKRKKELAEKEWERSARASAEENERIIRFLRIALKWLAALATVAAIIYGIVKFIKWAWYN